jgi:hypothetical protein
MSIGGPANGYTGPTALCVYFDDIYRTFAFDLVPPQTLPVAVTGTLEDAAGKPAPYEKVMLIDRGIKQITFTNSGGEFRFFGNLAGPTTIEAAGVRAQAAPNLSARPLSLCAGNASNRAK